MSGRKLGLWVCALGLAACSDDGVASTGAGTAGDGGTDPFMTTLPPMTNDPSSAEVTGNDMASDGPAGDSTSGGGAEPTTDATTSGPEPTGATDSGATDSGGTDTGATVDIPGAGSLVITEIMQNPAVLMDDEGEWFEVHNPSATVTYQLMGCTVEGSAPDTPFAIDVDLPIGPGEYLIFAVAFAGDPGFVPDFTWAPGTYTLNNNADAVTLTCDGNVVDTVAYDNGVTFPDPTGASMTLDPGSLDATANDDGTNWCEATTSYNGDLGTPGAANDMCM